jgi:hypothetical protein
MKDFFTFVEENSKMSDSLFTYTRRVRLKGKKFNGLFKIEDENEDEQEQGEVSCEENCFQKICEDSEDEKDHDEEFFQSDSYGRQKSRKHGGDWKRNENKKDFKQREKKLCYNTLFEGICEAEKCNFDHDKDQIKKKRAEVMRSWNETSQVKTQWKKEGAQERHGKTSHQDKFPDKTPHLNSVVPRPRFQSFLNKGKREKKEPGVYNMHDDNDEKMKRESSVWWPLCSTQGQIQHSGKPHTGASESGMGEAKQQLAWSFLTLEPREEITCQCQWLRRMVG